jgi:hypothetical protein
MTWDAHSALNDFRTIADLAGVRLRDDDILIENLPAPHIAPLRLPPGTMAVYAFSCGNEVLKVGKVGPNSHARYSYQHYNPGSAMSTLAGSLLADREHFGLVQVDQSTVSEWIKQNVDRVNFIVRASMGMHVLSLLESFLQCRLKPRYEGFRSQRIP